MALDPGVEKCVWEAGEWNKRREIRIGSEKVMMALVFKNETLGPPHIEIVEMRPNTFFHVYPRREGRGCKFEVIVMQADGLPPKKPKRWNRSSIIETPYG